MPEPTDTNVELIWDHTEPAPIAEIAEAVYRLSGCTIKIDEVDTGSDNYEISISRLGDGQDQRTARIEHELDCMIADRDALLDQRDRLIAERDALALQSTRLIEEREQYRLAADGATGDVASVLRRCADRIETRR